MNRIKLIMYYLRLFFITLITILLFVITLINFTLVNRKFHLSMMDSYYIDLYNEIYIDIKENTMSSGIDEELISKYFTKEDVTNDLNKYINYIFGKEDTSIDLTYIGNRIDKELDNYILENGINDVNYDDIKAYKNDILSIYNSKITIYNYLDKIRNPLKKIKIILIIINIILLILFIGYIYLFRKTIKSYIFISLYITGVMFIFMFIMMNIKIDIGDLMIIVRSLSDYIISIIDKFKYILLYTGIITFIISLIANIIAIKDHPDKIKYVMK